MNTTELTIPQTIDMALLPIKERAVALVITTPEEKQVAGQMYIDISLWEKDVKAYFKPMKDAANQAHKAITARENEQLARAGEIKQIIAPKLAVYTQEEERLRALSEAKAIDQYHKNQAEAAAKAEKLCKAGKSEQAAEVLLNVKTSTPTTPEPVKVSGLAMVEDYEITITNPDLVPREYCLPNEALIKGQIKLWQGKKQIPGVTFVRTLKPRRTGRVF